MTNDPSAAEQSLRESEQTFRAIANSIPQLAWMADASGWIFWYNERWYEYTGTTLDEMRGWGWMSVHHPEHVDRVVERIQHAFDTGEPWEDTFPLRSKAGEYRWFLSRALPIKDVHGHVIRWFGTNTDVTEQLAAAAERDQLLERERQARQRVTTILESITDAFFALGREWRFMYVNREAERVLRRSRAELLGKSIWEEFPEAVGTTFAREYHRAMAEQVTTEFEAFYPPFDSWFEVRAYPSSDGLSVYFHDVTERRRAADALRESEERFRALAENATAAIFVIDADSTIEFVNPAVERIFGCTDEEVLGQPLHRLMPHDQRPLHDAGIRQHLATGRRKLRWEGVELPGLTKDGRIVPLEISFGEFTRDGRRYFTGIARDITKRKQAERELREREQRYRLLADMIPQNIWTTDRRAGTPTSAGGGTRTPAPHPRHRWAKGGATLSTPRTGTGCWRAGGIHWRPARRTKSSTGSAEPTASTGGSSARRCRCATRPAASSSGSARRPTFPSASGSMKNVSG